jgi:heme exporter protein C
LVGAVNLPIIKFSVDWWNTLHQGESILAGQIAPVFLWPLLIMALGYMLLFATLWMVRIRTEIVNRRVRSLIQRGEAA